MGDNLAIGIDLGGTRLRAALVDAMGEIRARAAAPTDVAGGPSGVIAQIRGLLTELGVDLARPDLAGIGVCAPGPLDSETGVVLGIPTLPGWEGFPLRAALEQSFGKKVVVENDGIAAANGEWRHGAAQGLSHFVYVTVSTGIGGGVVVDGRLLRGRRGMIAHVGHMVIDPQGPVCSCGATGCFEAIASGNALGAAGRQRAADSPDTPLGRRNAVTPLDAPAIVAAAREGDAIAIDLLDREARTLGIGFSNLAHLYSPQAIVMGGGVSQAFDLLYPGIRRTLEATALPPFRDVAVLPSALGDNAGIIGAALLVWDRGRQSA
jgi:glucokinase